MKESDYIDLAKKCYAELQAPNKSDNFMIIKKIILPKFIFTLIFFK